MLTGPDIILTLKILVTAVTVLFAASIAAVAVGKVRLHGRLNTAFFVLTMSTVVIFEVMVRFGPKMTATFSDAAQEALRVHLCFAIPSAVILPIQFWAGKTHRRRIHLILAVLFVPLWLGTFISGVFFLPHD